MLTIYCFVFWLILGLIYAELGKLSNSGTGVTATTVDVPQMEAAATSNPINPPARKRQCTELSLFGHYRKNTVAQGKKSASDFFHLRFYHIHSVNFNYSCNCSMSWAKTLSDRRLIVNYILIMSINNLP
jgi:hypothetical protein